MTYRVKNIHISIDRPAKEVYDFASLPGNFPRWVKLIQSFSQLGDHWLGKTAQGDITINWAPINDFYVLDHYVTFSDGQSVFNAMRVIPNNEGSEFVFTLFHRPERSEAEFKEDADLVKADLEILKKIMEE